MDITRSIHALLKTCSVFSKCPSRANLLGFSTPAASVAGPKSQYQSQKPITASIERHSFRRYRPFQLPLVMTQNGQGLEKKRALTHFLFHSFSFSCKFSPQKKKGNQLTFLIAIPTKIDIALDFPIA